MISRRRFKANGRRPTSAVQSASNAGANINLGAKHGSFSKMVKRGWMEDRSISRFVASSRRRVPRVLHFSTDQEPDVYYVAARSSMQYIYICDFVPRARFFVVLFLQLSGWQSCNVDPFRSIGVAYIRVLICMLVWNIDRSCVMYILLYKYCWSEKRNYGIRIKS